MSVSQQPIKYHAYPAFLRPPTDSRMEPVLVRDEREAEPWIAKGYSAPENGRAAFIMQKAAPVPPSHVHHEFPKQVAGVTVEDAEEEQFVTAAAGEATSEDLRAWLAHRRQQRRVAATRPPRYTPPPPGPARPRGWQEYPAWITAPNGERVIAQDIHHHAVILGIAEAPEVAERHLAEAIARIERGDTPAERPITYTPSAEAREVIERLTRRGGIEASAVIDAIVVAWSRPPAAVEKPKPATTAKKAARPKRAPRRVKRSEAVAGKAGNGTSAPADGDDAR